MSKEERQYIVSARKYRPATFATVVGQPALTRTLRNAIDTGKLAQAYLFCGPRGVGKTSCARIFAKTINCLSPTADGEACGKCESCRAIDEGNSFNIIELDAASNNSVDDIRNLTEQVNIPPHVGKYRVFIIDEVHMLSSAAFNAFLKTLEEPPRYVIFILATTEKHKVIPTILSRCQIYDFKRITIADMVRHLQYVAEQEGIKAEPEALNVIARKADGAMRDALSIFDQVAASSMGKITYASAVENLNVLDYDYYFGLVEAFKARDIQKSLLLYKDIRDKGFDAQFFINGLAGHIRDLMVAASPQTVGLLEVADEVAKKYIDQARALPLRWYYDAIEILNRCDLDYRTVTDKRLHVELALIKLCRIGEVHAQQPVEQQPSQPTTNRPAATPTQATAAPTSASPAPKPAQPRVAPAVPMVPTVQAPRATVKVGRPSTFRLNAQLVQNAAQPAKAENPASEKKEERNAAYTDDDVAHAWERFIANNPDKHLLISSMRNSMPARDGVDGNYTVTVDSEVSRQTIVGNLSDLLDALRGELNSDNFSLNIVVSESGERQRKLTPKEFLSKVVSENSVLNELIDTMDFEFS